MDWKRAKDWGVTIATAVDPTVTFQRYRDCLRSINALYSNLVLLFVAGLLLAFSLGYFFGVQAR
jgi:hypothetical protein